MIIFLNIEWPRRRKAFNFYIFCLHLHFYEHNQIRNFCRTRVRTRGKKTAQCTVHNAQARVHSAQCTGAYAPFPDYVTCLGSCQLCYFFFGGFVGKFPEENELMFSYCIFTLGWRQYQDKLCRSSSSQLSVIIIVMIIMVMYKILIDKCSGSRWPSALNLLSSSRGRRRIKRN